MTSAPEAYWSRDSGQHVHHDVYAVPFTPQQKILQSDRSNPDLKNSYGPELASARVAGYHHHLPASIPAPPSTIPSPPHSHYSTQNTQSSHHLQSPPRACAQPQYIDSEHSSSQPYFVNGPTWIVRGPHGEEKPFSPDGSIRTSPPPATVTLGPPPRQRWRSAKIWMVFFFAAALIVLAVGLGVGLGLGLKKTSQSPTPSPQHTETPSSSSPTAPAADRGGTTTPSPSSGTPTDSAIATSGTTGTAANSCNYPSPRTYTAKDSKTRFTTYCFTDWYQNDPAADGTGARVKDISKTIKYTFEDCMEACVSWNANPARPAWCAAVTYNSNLTDTIRGQSANCFLKDRKGMDAQGSAESASAVIAF